MAAVTVSPKFQVVIPKEVRQAIGLAVGDKMEVIQLPGRIELVPVKMPRELRGILRKTRQETRAEEKG